MRKRSDGLARKAGKSLEAETVAIVCEGEKTEDIYFNGVRRTLRLPTARLCVLGIGADPVKVVEKAMTFVDTYDHVWAAFDVEAPLPHARLNEALQLAKKYSIKCAISNPCFEIWLLLHFRKHTGFLDNPAVRRALRASGCGYNDKGFDFDATWIHHPEAIERATRLDEQQRIDHPDIASRNPWTSVHKLLLELLKLTTPTRTR